MLPRVSATIAALSDFFAAEWPTSFATWLPGGSAPEPWSNFRNPALAATWQRLLSEAEARQGREAGIEAARNAFYNGFVAEAIDRFIRSTEVMDASGTRHKGVLTASDLSGWQATVEAPVTHDYHGWTIAKTGPWGQGPVLLQSLALLENFDLAAMDPLGAEFVPHRYRGRKARPSPTARPITAIQASSTCRSNSSCPAPTMPNAPG